MRGSTPGGGGYLMKNVQESQDLTCNIFSKDYRPKCITVKEKVLFEQIIWLLPSYANSRNVVLVKHYVGGE